MDLEIMMKGQLCYHLEINENSYCQKELQGKKRLRVMNKHK